MQPQYFIDGKEVTKEEAKKQEKLNNEILSIVDTKEFLRRACECKFIFITRG